MARLKNKTQGNYTVVSQNIMRDRELSLTERGLLLTLLSLPDYWNLTIKGLSQILPDGKDKIQKTLNSLIAKGYVTRIQSRDSSGQFDSNSLEVHESPVMAPTPTPPPKKGDKDKESKAPSKITPYPENPDAVNRDTGNPAPEIPTQYINNKSNNHKDNIHKVCKADTLTDDEYDDLVSEFGKANVDYQIQRITDRGYKGCLNYETVRTWCRERLDRPATFQNSPPRKNAFCSFQQNEYDFEELERQLLCN